MVIYAHCVSDSVIKQTRLMSYVKPKSCGAYEQPAADPLLQFHLVQN